MGGQAIVAPRVNLFLLKPEEITIVTDSKHPLYDKNRADKPIDEAMVLSMMVPGIGVVTPIVVVKDGPNVVVVDGRRRVKAAIEANKRLLAKGMEQIKIPTMLRKGQEDTQVGVMIISNNQREADEPVDLAEKMARYMALGHNEAEAAVIAGMKPSAFKQLMALLDCAKPVQKAVTEGAVSISAAAELAKLTKEEQVPALEKLVVEAGERKGAKRKGKVTVKNTRRATGRGDSAPSKKQIRVLFESALLAGDDMTDTLNWVLTGERHGKIGAALKKLEAAAESKAA